MTAANNGNAIKYYLSPPDVGSKERAYLLEAFDSNWIAPVGPFLTRFEKAAEDYLGEGHAVAVSCGAAAISLALELSGVGSGDLVLCPTLTFVATVAPVVHRGAVPVFIDSDLGSWNLDPELLEQALADLNKKNRLPKAVIAVHLYGRTADLKKICSICERYGVALIEDAAESLGTTYEGRQSGCFGDFGIFSFNGNKIITTSGGGMLVCKQKSQADRARFLASQAKEKAPHYQHEVLGYNYGLSNLLAAIGLAQLEGLEQKISNRKKVFEQYQDHYKDFQGIDFIPSIKGVKPNYWLTCLTLNPEIIKATPYQIKDLLMAEGIEARVLWKPMHLQPVFKDVEVYGGSVSEQLFATGLCLPSGSSLSENDVNNICKTFDRALEIQD